MTTFELGTLKYHIDDATGEGHLSLDNEKVRGAYSLYYYGERKWMDVMCQPDPPQGAIIPSRAISFGDRQDIDGVKRWRIDSVACFTLWRTLGTDCGRCVRVCP